MSTEQGTDEQAPVDLALRGYALLVCLNSTMSQFSVPNAGACDIGRDEACDVWIDDSNVSRRHARIHPGNPPELEDLRSRNGTRVGARLLESGARVPIPIGTVIEIGAATLVVQAANQVLRAQRARPRAELPPGVVVASSTMKRIYEFLDLVAPSMLSVIILGETGVGKEVLAAELHRRSRRASGPFMALNCAGLAENLLESELFGYERGAFTGAVRSKVGLFEAANGGTVFLDEVGELPIATQAKLLRVLETGELMRLGSVTCTRVDLRFVAATHRDLPERAAENAFRQDLYFRLNGVTMTIPPLRERRDDIAPLAHLLAAKACDRSGVPRVKLGTSALEKLEEHEWPGNVRELRNVVERAVLLARGGRVDAEHIALDAPRSQRTAPPSGLLRDQVHAFERERIVDALARTRGHQTEAAELLGISRRTLIEKLDAYGIERPRKR